MSARLAPRRVAGFVGEIGRMFSVGLEAAHTVFRRPWPLEEFLSQIWFLAKVTTVPVILISIPFGMIISLHVGSFLTQLGAQAHMGAAMVLAVVREEAPVATALLIAGAGGSAMCADLGARRIRDEIDAMEVLGIDPVQRLIMPRVFAAMIVAILLDAIVSVAGIAGGWFFAVTVQHGSTSSYFNSFNELSQIPDLFMALFKAMPASLHYRKVIAFIVSDITIGAGALIVGAGTFFVIFAMSFFPGTQVGLEGFQGLSQIGAQAFTGLVSSWANTREITPLVAGVALAAQVGTSFTAEIGAARISDEIDALEVMAIPSLTYVVATRVWAALFTMIPLYLAALFSSYLATQLIVTKFFTLSTGTYVHYFHLFLPPIDVLYSLIKAMVFAIVVTMIHCYYGYNATGGPAGVGVASGRAIRSSIVTVVVINLFLSIIFWGGGDTVRIA